MASSVDKEISSTYNTLDGVSNVEDCDVIDSTPEISISPASSGLLLIKPTYTPDVAKESQSTMNSQINKPGETSDSREVENNAGDSDKPIECQKCVDRGINNKRSYTLESGEVKYIYGYHSITCNNAGDSNKAIECQKCVDKDIRYKRMFALNIMTHNSRVRAFINNNIRQTKDSVTSMPNGETWYKCSSLMTSKYIVKFCVSYHNMKYCQIQLHDSIYRDSTLRITIVSIQFTSICLIS